MADLKSGSFAARRAQYNALKTAGLDDRAAGIGTFPELNPDGAAVQMSAVPQVNAINADTVTSTDVSRHVAVSDLRAALISQQLAPQLADTIAKRSYEFVPDTASGNPVRWEKLREITRKAKDAARANEPVERALIASGVMDDMRAMGAVLQGVASGPIDASLAGFSGESPSDMAARLWPKADIRDDEGTLTKKAVVPYALKTGALGIGAQVMNALSFGAVGAALGDKVRRDADRLMESDYRDDLITGNEMVEYWMSGFGANLGFLPASSLPDKDTPERAEYDKIVREVAAENYASLDNKPFGGLAMLGMAFGGATAEVFMDPGLWLSGVPTSAFAKTRLLLPVSSRTRMTSAVADRTGRLEHTLIALDDAKKWVQKSGDTYFNQTNASNKAHFDQARRTLVRQQARRDAFAAGPGEQLMLPILPRIRPEHIKDVRSAYRSVPGKGKEASAGRKAAMKEIARGRINEASVKVKDLEKAVARARNQSPDMQPTMFTNEQMGDDVAPLEARLKDAIKVRDDWKQTKKFLSEKARTPGSRTGAQLNEEAIKQGEYVSDGLRVGEEGADMTRSDALTAVQNNIKRGARAARTADHTEAQRIENEIIQWERTYTEVAEGGNMSPEVLNRSRTSVDEILYQSLEAQRRKIAGMDPTPIADYSRADPTQLAQRIAHGPDQREAASEAARILAMGGEIDDMAFHGLNMDIINTSYGEVLRPASGTEARAAAVEWLGEEAFGTKIEAAAWQQSWAEKMGDHWARALYPGTWNARPAGILFGIREPMRTLQSVNPKLYTRIHDALNAQKFEITRMNEIFSRELQILGVYKNVKGNMVMDPEASARFYEIMNMVPSGEKYELAMSALTETERRSLRRVRQEMDFMADKQGLPLTARYIEGYIDHVFDRRWNKNAGRVGAERGLGATAEVRNPHLLEREGVRGYEKNLAMALDEYAKAASRQLHFEPMYEDMLLAVERHLKTNPGDEWFGVYINHMINNFKGQPSTLGQWVDINLSSLNARMRARDTVMNKGKQAGRVMEKVAPAMTKTGEVLSKLPDLKFGKLGTAQPGKFGGALQAEGVRVGEYGSQMALRGFPLYNSGDASRTAMGVTALIYSSVLAGSGRYLPMAVATGLATTGSRYGIFNTLRGVLAMATDDGRALARSAGLEKQWVQIMEDAAWTKLGKLATNMPTFNGVTVVGPSISATENLVRGWTFHAAAGDLMRKQGFTQWSEVVEAGFGRAYLHEATRITEEVNHLFGQLGKPPAFHRMSKSGSVAMTQFLSFIPKQTEELMAQMMDNPGKIAQYMMISGYTQRIVAKTGLDVSDYVGMGFIPQNPDEATSISFEMLEAMMGSAHEMSMLMSGEGDPTAAERANERLAKAAHSFIPLASVANRITRAETALRTGNLYSEDGALLYEYDLGKFEWDENASTASNLLRAQSPEHMGAPGDPSEMLALRTGLSSVKQNLERTQFKALRAQTKQRMYRRQKIVEGMEAAVSGKDPGAFDYQWNLGVKEGMIPPELDGVMERATYEMTLPRLLREQLDSDQKLIDSAESFPSLRARYEMMFGTTPGRR